MSALLTAGYLLPIVMKRFSGEGYNYKNVNFKKDKRQEYISLWGNRKEKKKFFHSKEDPIMLIPV